MQWHSVHQADVGIKAFPRNTNKFPTDISMVQQSIYNHDRNYLGNMMQSWAGENYIVGIYNIPIFDSETRIAFLFSELVLSGSNYTQIYL